MDHLVFVYGSLKKGFHNNTLLRNSEYLGTGETSPEYTMLHLGGFPGVILNGEDSIKGEVYKVDRTVSRNLDALEGYPSFYTKETVETSFGEATMYVLNEERGRYTPGKYRVVPDGIWTQEESLGRRVA